MESSSEPARGTTAGYAPTMAADSTIATTTTAEGFAIATTIAAATTAADMNATNSSNATKAGNSMAREASTASAANLASNRPECSRRVSGFETWGSSVGTLVIVSNRRPLRLAVFETWDSAPHHPHDSPSEPFP